MRISSFVAAAFVVPFFAACAAQGPTDEPNEHHEGSSTGALTIATVVKPGGTSIPIVPLPPAGTTQCVGDMTHVTVTFTDTPKLETYASCFPFTCGNGTCRTACTTNADCAADAHCAAGKCRVTLPPPPVTFHCVKDAQGWWSEVNSNGASNSCGSYRCNDVDGRCFTTCKGNYTEDCRAGALCDSTGPSPSLNCIPQ